MKFLQAPIYLLLLAIYPIVAVMAENVDWGVSPISGIVPVLLSLFVAAAGWKVAIRVLGHCFTKVTAVFLWIAFWLWYGAFVQLFASVTGKHGPDAYVYGFPFWLLGLVAIAITLKRPCLLIRSTRYLNLFGTILILFPILTLLKGSSTQLTNWDSLPLPSAAKTSTDLPDIYFIILDGYSSTELLGRVWNYDNRLFAESLRGLGFFVPTNSHSNYVHTHLSLASMLNWQHLLTLEDGEGDGRDRSYTYAMIENNRAALFLQSIGYKFVFFPTTFPGTDRNRLADRQIPATPLRETSWLAVWLAQTPVTALIYGICEIMGCQAKRFPYPVETAPELKLKFQRLSRLPGEPGPKFVLAHILLPHPPYVLRSDCSGREPSWPSSGDRSRWSEVRQGYVEQLTCLNRMLLKLVGDLMAQSDKQPVIILQADHGHGRIQLDPMINETIPLDDLSQTDIDDRTRIFAAYYLPDLGDSVFYDSITPVNVFPVILNGYFETEIPLREDATYWSTYRKSYVFTRVPTARHDSHVNPTRSTR